MCCIAYDIETQDNNWKEIEGNDVDVQYSIALKIKKRMEIRENMLQEDGLASISGSNAPL